MLPHSGVIAGVLFELPPVNYEFDAVMTSSRRWVQIRKGCRTPFPEGLQWPKKHLGVASAALVTASLQETQGRYPFTDHSEWFCLLCCQPKPIPTSLSARTPLLTLSGPCGLWP